MKKIAIFLVLFFCEGCDRNGDYVKRVYKVENSSGHEITVVAHSLNEGSIYWSRHILTNGVIWEGHSDNGLGREISASRALGKTDSVVVTFDNLKRQIYYFSNYGAASSPKVFRNIFIDSTYTIESNELYRFIFTEEDYNMAEDCGGKCN